MKKQYFLLFTAVLSIITGLSSCKPEPLKGERMNADFKQYFDYKTGSYWIFYDSLNNKQDSVVVTGYEDIAAQDGENKSDERVSLGAEHYSPKTGLIDYSIILDLTAPYKSILDVTYNGNHLNYFFVSHMPFVEVNEGDSTTELHAEIHLFSSYTIGGVDYSNVYRAIYKYNKQPYADTFCINADNGLIAVLLNDQYFHKRLFLQKSKLVR